MHDEEWLRKQCETRSGRYLRPLSPNIAWRDAKVVLVGQNPATPIRRERMTFDAFWDSLTRDPEPFNVAYAEAREERYGSDEPSKTTKRRIIFEQALGVKCLVTNVCAYPAFKARDIPRKHRGPKGTGYEILTALLEIVQPRAILFQGAEAVKFAERKFERKLDIWAEPNDQEYTGTSSWYASAPVLLLASVHFNGARRFEPDVMDRRVQLFGKLISRRLTP